MSIHLKHFKAILWLATKSQILEAKSWILIDSNSTKIQTISNYRPS